MIGGFITYWLAKPVLCWLFKRLSAAIRGKRTYEQDVLNTLTAGTPEHEGDLIRHKPTFDSLDAKNLDDGPIRKQFTTGSFSCTQNWDYAHDENVIVNPKPEIYGNTNHGEK